MDCMKNLRSKLVVLSFSALTVAVVLLAGGLDRTAAQTSAPLKWRFSRETMVTNVATTPLRLSATDDELLIAASYSYRGSVQVDRPASVILEFSENPAKRVVPTTATSNSVSPLWKFGGKSALWADGKKLVINSAGTGGMIRAVGADGQPQYPPIRLLLDTSTFAKLAQARTARIQLGGFKFSLTPEQLESFQILLAAMKQTDH